MAVTPLRRIGPPAGPSLYDRMAGEALHAAWSRGEIEAAVRDHPGLVVERDGNIVLAFRRFQSVMAYAFRSDRAFVDHFPRMFETLLPALRRELEAETVRFRLLHSPSRPVVEPVLKKLWFSPAPAWLLMSLDRRGGVPKAPLPSGVTIREAGFDDLDALARIDLASFPDTPMPRQTLREQLAGASRALAAVARREVVAFATYSRPDPEWAHLQTLAVLPGHRGRGVGAALTARVAKRMFAEGAPRLDLKVNDDNAGAIHLYVRLGFRQTAAGRDYTRPADPRVIARLKKSTEGTLVRFGGWR